MILHSYRVPNAIPGRQNTEIEIFGMDGIPDEDIQAHITQLEQRDPNKKLKMDDTMIALLESRKFSLHETEASESTPTTPQEMIYPPPLIDNQVNLTLQSTILHPIPTLFQLPVLPQQKAIPIYMNSHFVEPVKPTGQISGNSEIVYFSETLSIEEVRATYPQYLFVG